MVLFDDPMQIDIPPVPPQKVHLDPFKLAYDSKWSTVLDVDDPGAIEIELEDAPDAKYAKRDPQYDDGSRYKKYIAGCLLFTLVALAACVTAVVLSSTSADESIPSSASSVLGSTTITQEVTYHSLDEAGFQSSQSILNNAYAISIGIMNSDTLQYYQGCDVSSSSVSSRRGCLTLPACHWPLPYPSYILHRQSS